MFFNKSKGIIVGLSLIFALAGCGSNDKSTDESSKKDEVVASVNGQTILSSEYSSALEQYKLNYAQSGIDVDSLGEEETKLLEQQALDQLINNELVLQAADKDEIVTSPEDVTASLTEIKGQFETDEQYNEALEANNLTEEELEAQIAKDLKISKYLTSKIPTPEATDEEIKEMYDQYTEVSEEEELPTLEEVKPQIEQTIVQQKQQQEIQALLDQLREDSEIEKFI
ncbi:SurA N-terminal domain-containing protein [Bacillus sp. PS06]|uniref:SurA N-terminal domain-containing protein n=1 Tax=Bacillus sp. PS06 TaxID=2764176 RepID=UPI00177FB23D|nr:SurA N-terminal domain-containing protein [Bacillus sp. PS06]MBD8071058.1 SurA N-terminal domain-containing protein [Bacillus sp. PS06]